MNQPDLWGVFHVELVSGCPNNCEACASSNGLYLMDEPTMENVVQQIKVFKNKYVNTRVAVKLFGTGEGVLHPCLDKYAARFRAELDPEFMTLSTNIKTLARFGPDLPSDVAVVVSSRLDDTFDSQVVSRYGGNRLGILVPDATDSTISRIIEINELWPTPSIQLTRMSDLEIPRRGSKEFVRRTLPFSGTPPFRTDLIRKLTDKGLVVVDEFQPAYWNLRATFRYDGMIDACLMRQATINFDFSSDEFYSTYFQARKTMCTNCPRHHGVFTLSLQKDPAVAEARKLALVGKGLPADVVVRR